MTPRMAIAQIAKAVGRELESKDGPGESALAAAAAALASDCGATETLQGLWAEANRKRPSDRTLDAYAFMLEAALETLRIEANGGNLSAGREIEEVRQTLEQTLANGPVPTGALMLVARAFAQAGLDPGQALQQAMMGAMEAEADDIPPEAARTRILSQFDDLAAALDHDPFAIHAELATMGAAFPAEYRATMATALAMSGTEAVREAALGFAFSSDAAVSTAAISALAKHAHEAMASNATIERLVRMRPWFSAARQADVDAAIRALRAKAAPPKASQRPEIRSVAASLCDGAGAQSLFALAKRGRRFAMAAVLVKTDAGVADAWVRDDMNSRAEADALIEEILAQTEAVEISIGLFERRLAAALETNVARDAPPPFGLLQVAEMLGLGALYPEPLSPSAIVDTLLAELPAERTNPAAEVAAHQVSMTWDEEFSTVDSWFEAGQAVESLLRPLKTRKRRIEAVLTNLLPGRRSFWAERCAWMAATLKDGAEEGDEAWIDFALVARDLAGERPLATIPIASRIAEATVDAFRQR